MHVYHKIIVTVFSQRPRFHELDLIRANQKTVRILEGSASKWDGIACRLYYEGNMISQIKTESQNDGLRACQSVFSEWLDGKVGLRTPISWGTVVEVLKEAHLGQLAEDLAEVLRGRWHKYMYVATCTCIYNILHYAMHTCTMFRKEYSR